MSIEDIDFLYKNSEKNNVIVFVDSSKRNKKIYNEPNSYSITFDEPFKFVWRRLLRTSNQNFEVL